MYTFISASATSTDKCAWGESYWCSDLKIAKECGAVQHCISTVWKNTVLPEVWYTRFFLLFLCCIYYLYIYKGTFPPLGRPIISGNGCSSERISSFVDFFLKEISPKGKSYLKDTTHFIQTLDDLGTIPDGAILATLDVSSLYTNIPNGEGIRSMGKVLEAFRPNGQILTNTSLLRLLTLVLRTNNFTFCGKHFLQVGGTAMGTKAAPNYMHCWEKKFVYGKSGGLYLGKGT